MRVLVHAASEPVRQRLLQRLARVGLPAERRSALAVSVSPDGTLHLCLHRPHGRSLHVARRHDDVVDALDEAVLALGPLLTRQLLRPRRVVVARAAPSRAIDRRPLGGINPLHGPL